MYYLSLDRGQIHTTLHLDGQDAQNTDKEHFQVRAPCRTRKVRTRTIAKRCVQNKESILALARHWHRKPALNYEQGPEYCAKRRQMEWPPLWSGYLLL